MLFVNFFYIIFFCVQKSKLKIAFHDSINHSKLSVADCQLLTANYLPFIVVFSRLCACEKKRLIQKQRRMTFKTIAINSQNLYAPNRCFSLLRTTNIYSDIKLCYMLTYITILTEKCFFCDSCGLWLWSDTFKTKITSSSSVYSPKPNNLVQKEQYTECIQNTQKYESSEVYILSYRKKIK